VEIGNAAVWLAKRIPSPDEILPAWAIQRVFGGRLPVVPDLLALWRQPAAALAVEVDLGTEPLTTILLPKLSVLRRSLGEWTPSEVTTILVLVPSARRREALLGGLGETVPATVVDLLASLRC
jgi:hypothetical protein